MINSAQAAAPDRVCLLPQIAGGRSKRTARNWRSKVRSRYTEVVEFEWDPRKAAENVRKHKVSFNEAATVFGDLLSSTVPDPDHSADEHRYITVGQSERGRLLIVAHADRGSRIRIISARKLTTGERRAYEKRMA